MAIISAFGADDNGSTPFKTTTTNNKDRWRGYNNERHKNTQKNT